MYRQEIADMQSSRCEGFCELLHALGNVIEVAPLVELCCMSFFHEALRCVIVIWFILLFLQLQSIRSTQQKLVLH